MDVIDEAYIGKGDTHIKDGVWLGMRAMIMPGVTIGEGAIVAANSVVTKDVEPYTIVGGSPAKLVKHRFDKPVVEELISMKIYDWPPEKFESLRRHLCDSDLSKLTRAITDYDKGL
ncbi:antibiotic acetyltransferase [Vibrionales bacterium SWAT-3]|nr:antibiotic acetyltransferase [Vibrionales bacterium SWAT-3]